MFMAGGAEDCSAVPEFARIASAPIAFVDEEANKTI